MRREILTERDIEDMFHQGITSLELKDNIQLTQLAYEKANQLGMRLMDVTGDPNPAGPIRPYLSRIPADKQTAPQAPRVERAPTAIPAPTLPPPPAKKASPNGLDARIRAAVTAQMGNAVDPHVLDQIIQGVLLRTGLK